MPRNLVLCPDGADFHRYLQVLCSAPFSAYLPPSIQDALPSVLAYARNTAANQDKAPGQRQPYTEKATLEGAYALLQATPPLATHIAEAAANSVAGAPAGTVAAGPDPAVAAVVAAVLALAQERVLRAVARCDRQLLRPLLRVHHVGLRVEVRNRDVARERAMHHGGSGR